MKKSAPAEREVQLEAVGAGNDRSMSVGQPRELDHGVDDLLAAGIGIRQKHFNLSNGRRVSRNAAMKPLAAHVELDFARHRDDGFRVMAVLEQRVADGCRAVGE